jgi:hypothetical protein
MGAVQPKHPIAAVVSTATNRRSNWTEQYLLRTKTPHLSSEDIALGYKQLLEVEHRWRDREQVLELRPVFHRSEDRIRTHVLPVLP